MFGKGAMNLTGQTNYAESSDWLVNQTRVGSGLRHTI